MKVSVMMGKDELNVAGWYAHSPEIVLEMLRQQLEAAAVIWPELSQFRIAKPKVHSKVAGGTAGGHARAAALTPEQRSEIGRKAAEARWGTPKEKA